MIEVNITRNDVGMIKSFTISGHALFAKKGKDIVCAGASAVSVGTINAIHALTGVTPLIEHREDGFLSCRLQDNLPEEIQEKIQLLLEGMVVSLQGIENEYEKHLKITFKKQGVK